MSFALKFKCNVTRHYQPPKENLFYKSGICFLGSSVVSFLPSLLLRVASRLIKFTVFFLQHLSLIDPLLSYEINGSKKSILGMVWFLTISIINTEIFERKFLELQDVGLHKKIHMSRIGYEYRFITIGLLI